jgi:hypothetical protein
MLKNIRQFSEKRERQRRTVKLRLKVAVWRMAFLLRIIDTGYLHRFFVVFLSFLGGGKILK